MKKIFTLFAMLLMAAMTVGAQTVISIGASTGTFYSGTTEKTLSSSNQYLNKWVSSTTPALTFSCSANNIIINSDYPTDTKFNLHTDPSNYTLSYPDGKILSYSITAYVTNSGSINGTAVSTDADNPTTIEVTDINATTATIVIAGTANPWMYVTEFTVTVEEPTEEQLDAAQKTNSWLEVMCGQALVTDASNYLSNALQSGEGSYAALLDNDNATYFHSQWSGAMVNTPGHDLQARLPEAVDKFHIYYVTRSTGTGYPTAFRIDGSNNAADFTDAAEGGETWTENVASLNDELPAGATKAYMSDAITLTNSYQYLRFVPTIGNNQGANWFCLAEFWLLPSNDEFDAAINYLKNPKPTLDLTPEDIAEINAIDEALKSTTVTVTYELYDNGTKVNSIEVLQGKNSAVNVPAELTNGYSSMGYDFTPSGTIGSTDCTIEVTATPKEGVVTDLTNLSNDKAYLLTTERGSLGSNGTQMVSTNGTSYSASDFAIINYEGNYYLWSIDDDKWVKNQTQPALTENVSEAGTLVFDPSGIDKPLFFIGMGTNGVNIAGGYGTGVVVNTWTSRDAGNQYIIKENGNFDPTNAITALDEYFHPSYTITYVVKSEDGETLFTSEPVGTTAGAQITTLPEDYQHPEFYTYDEVDVTISDTETTIEFTATLKEDAVFQFTADTTEPIWYNLTIRPDNSSITAYPTYVEGGDPNVTLPADLAEDETTQWAFIGEPYAGFQIVNRAAGTDLVLGSDNADNDGNTGGNTYATLASPGSKAYELWTVTASSEAEGGFFINNAEGQYLNRRSNDNLAYWTGGHDIGSTFVATLVEDDVTAIDNLQFTNDNSAIYDLQGRLVNGKLPKGVFIQNGKKVVVK